MTLDSIDLMTIQYPVPDEQYPGAHRLYRGPETLRQALNAGAQKRILEPASGEIRFVSEDASARITLSAVNETARGSVFFGDFLADRELRIGSEPQTVELQGAARLPKERTDALGPLCFSPQVIRLAFWGAPIRLHAVEGPGLRPPKAGELPSRRLLMYGTSITHGACASAPHLSYPALLARHLNMDLINLGLGGSCHCEPKMADFIAQRSDWHAAVLALSVNMVDRFSLEEFSERVRNALKRVAGADSRRPVFAVTLYPHFRDFGLKGEEQAARAEAFRSALRAAAEDCPQPNLHLLEGPDMLTNPRGLTPDLIHPSDFGMMEMAANLAAAMRPHL